LGNAFTRDWWGEGRPWPSCREKWIQEGPARQTKLAGKGRRDLGRDSKTSVSYKLGRQSKRGGKRNGEKSRNGRRKRDRKPVAREEKKTRYPFFTGGLRAIAPTRSGCVLNCREKREK